VEDLDTLRRTESPRSRLSTANPHQVLRSYRRDDSVVDRRVNSATVRRILGYARPYRWYVTALIVTLVLDSGIVVATPLLFRRIIDQGVTPGNRQVVTVCALLIAGLAVLDAGVTLISRWYSSRIGEGLIFNLRTQVFDHVQRMPIAFFTRTQTGALVSRLNSDVIGAQQAFTSTLSGVVGNFITLIFVVTAMMALSWQITVASLVMLPIFLIPARYMGRTLQSMTREQMQLNADMASQMTERFNISGALLVKLFGRPSDESSSFSARAGRVRDIGVRIAMANRIFFTALALVAALATALVYGIGGNLAISGMITVGTLLALAALLTRLYGPLTALSNVRVDVMTALVSFERVFEVLDLEPMVKDRPDARAIDTGPTTIDFRSVRFHYPRADEVSLASLESIARPDTGEPIDVLRDITFTAEPGSMVALVGPSGAGKTTITSLVSRLYDVTDGAVVINGSDVRDVTLESLHALVGVVTQDAHMFHETIRANLTYAQPSASEQDIRRALADAQILDLVDSLPDGLDTVVGDRGYRLSGGEKQRMAIARLLLKAPDVVVLDEATAHLDSESEAAVQRALATALKGRTSLVIAHRLSTIREADQILVIDDGRVVQRGRHEDLLEQGGLYRDLYLTQFRNQDDSADDSLML
jgi:ATP-binding cassette subfamily B protein